MRHRRRQKSIITICFFSPCAVKRKQVPCACDVAYVTGSIQRTGKRCAVHTRSTAHWPRSQCINQQTGVCGVDSNMKLSFILRLFLIRISTTWPSSVVYRRPWRRWQRKPGSSFWTRCESVGLRFQRTKSRKVGIASFR